MIYKYNEEEYTIKIDENGITVTSKKEPNKKCCVVDKNTLFSKVNKEIDKIALKPTKVGLQILKGLKEMGCKTFNIGERVALFSIDTEKEFIKSSSDLLPIPIDIDTNFEFKSFERYKQYNIDDFIK